MALTSKLTNIADAIREKTGSTDALTLDAMAEAIAGIESGGGASFPNGTNWTQTNFTNTGLNGLNFVTYADGLWVASYNNGYIYTSDDGIVWQNKGDRFSVNVLCAYYSGGLFVAGTNGGLYYSTDGITWTQSNVTSGTALKVVKANGLWVAATGSGLYYSTDGITWTQSNVTKSSYSRYIYYSSEAGVWVAADTYLCYSTDGMTWTTTSKPKYVYCVRYGKGLFVLSCDSGLYYSTDCITWTQSNVTSKGNYIHYADGLWVASVINSGLWYSTDGMTWTQSNFTSSTTASSRSNLIYKADGVWVASIEGTGNGVYYSTDGMTWTKSNLAFSTDYGACNYLGHEKGVWVIAGPVIGVQYSPTWQPA